MTALDTKALEAAAQAAFEAGWPNERERQEQMERNPDTLVGYRKIIGPAVRAYFSALSPSQGEGPAADVVAALQLAHRFTASEYHDARSVAMEGEYVSSEARPVFRALSAALASLAPRAAQEAPADEQLGETSHVADDGQPDEAQEWHDYDPDC